MKTTEELFAVAAVVASRRPFSQSASDSPRAAIRRLASYWVSSFDPGRAEGVRRYSDALVTANAIDVLRARPILGRGFLHGEDAPGAEPVAVDLSYDPPCGSYRGKAVPGYRRSLGAADLQFSRGTLALRTPSRASARHFIQGAA